VEKRTLNYLIKKLTKPAQLTELQI